MSSIVGFASRKSSTWSWSVYTGFVDQENLEQGHGCTESVVSRLSLSLFIFILINIFFLIGLYMIFSYNEGILAGCLSGFATTLLGFPLDTMKTFQQEKGTLPKTVRQCYSGIRFPLLQNTVFNALFFYKYESLKKEYKDNLLLCNFYMAMYNSIIICPMDKFKIMNQQQIPYPITLKNILLSYKDFGIVCARKVPGTLLYFSSYQYFSTCQYSPFIAGGMAGVLSWLGTYPIDTIKTRIQTNPDMTVHQALAKGNLWKGISLCLGRAFFVNAFHFYMYEKALLYLKGCHK